MTWSDAVIEQFELVNHLTTDESEYYGPFNTLLGEVFPPSQHFQIAPQFKGPITPGSVDFTTIYIVRKRKLPVMFIEIKTFINLDDMSTREQADNQMRDHFYRLAGSIKIPILYGISAMGTRFCVYEYNKKTGALSPAAILRDPTFLLDVAPAVRWAHDLMEPAGEQVFKDIGDRIKLMCSDVSSFTYSRERLLTEYLDWCLMLVDVIWRA